MPFKLRLIKGFQKCITQSQETIEGEDQMNLPSQTQPHGKQKGRCQKKILKKNYNIYQNSLVRLPIEQRHIANFFNIIGINQEAVRSNDCQESYFRTLFYLKNVKKIQSRPNYLLLHLVDANLDLPPIQYIIERFQSFGDVRFYNLANLIIQVVNRLNDLIKVPTSSERDEGGEFLERYTQGLGNRLFACRINNNKMLLSKSLLETLEYDPEQFALETLRFRTSIYEAASTERYYDVLVKFFENTINLLDLVCDRISLQTFLNTSVLRFRDCLYTRKNRKLHCKIKTGTPHPLVNIFQVEEIISKSEEFETNMFYKYQPSIEIRKTREDIHKRQIGTVLSLMDLPKNFQPQYEDKVASYCVIDPKCQR